MDQGFDVTNPASKGSFNAINHSLASEDIARENIWTSCARLAKTLKYTECLAYASPVSLPLSSPRLYFEKLFCDDFGFLQVQKKKFRTCHILYFKKGTSLLLDTTMYFCQGN